MHLSPSGMVPAFQAGDEGSIPSRCSRGLGPAARILGCLPSGRGSIPLGPASGLIRLDSLG